MKTNDLKKDTRVVLSNGWYATLFDNAKGDTRLAMVEGYVCETGSIYSHDIAYAIIDGVEIPIEHTPKQLKLKKMVGAFYG